MKGLALLQESLQMLGSFHTANAVSNFFLSCNGNSYMYIKIWISRCHSVSRLHAVKYVMLPTNFHVANFLNVLIYIP